MIGTSLLHFLSSALRSLPNSDLLTDAPTPTGIISRITRNRTLFRMALSAAVALSITGSIEQLTGTKSSTITLGQNLRKIAVIIFLVLTILLAFQTVLLMRSELTCKSLCRSRAADADPAPRRQLIQAHE